MHARLLPIFVLSTIAVALVALSGCSSSRVEAYHRAQDAAVLDQSAMIDVQVLYLKQTQRDLQTVVRITNHARLPLRWTRLGAQALAATLTVEGVAHPALPPRAVTWTPWSVGPQRMAGVGETTIEPGSYADLELRFEYPQAIGVYRYPWDLTLAGIQLDVIDTDPVRIHWPPTKAPSRPSERTKPIPPFVIPLQGE